MVTVAMALVAAIVLVEIIGRGARQSLAPSWAGVFVLSVLAGILVVTMGNNLRLWTRRDSPLKGVTQGERAVMEWIRENTPSNARFLVLDGATRWAADRYAEWFPVLSNRVSVATPQMAEWLPDHWFSTVLKIRNAGYQSLYQGSTKFQSWLKTGGSKASYLLLMGSILNDRNALESIRGLVDSGGATLRMWDDNGAVLELSTME